MIPIKMETAILFPMIGNNVARMVRWNERCHLLTESNDGELKQQM